MEWFPLGNSTLKERGAEIVIDSERWIGHSGILAI